MWHSTNAWIILCTLWPMKVRHKFIRKEKIAFELVQIVNKQTKGNHSSASRDWSFHFLFRIGFQLIFFSFFFLTWIFRKRPLIGKVKMRHFQSWWKYKFKPQTDIKYIYMFNTPKGNDFPCLQSPETKTKLSLCCSMSTRRRVGPLLHQSRWCIVLFTKKGFHWINSINMHLFRCYFGIGFPPYFRMSSLHATFGPKQIDRLVYGFNRYTQILYESQWNETTLRWSSTSGKKKPWDLICRPKHKGKYTNRFISFIFYTVVSKYGEKKRKTSVSLQQELLLNGFRVYRAYNLVSGTKYILKTSLVASLWVMVSALFVVFVEFSENLS